MNARRVYFFWDKLATLKEADLVFTRKVGQHKRYAESVTLISVVRLEK